jgi:hypothetical protein
LEVNATCDRGERQVRRQSRPREASKKTKTGAAADRVALSKSTGASMEFFSGLDVSIGETAIYVVDDKGAVHLQTSFPTDGEAIMQVLKPFLARLRRVGHEVGSLSPWLHPELVKRGLPAVCLETQHVRAAMSAQRNKMVCPGLCLISSIMSLESYASGRS